MKKAVAFFLKIFFLLILAAGIFTGGFFSWQKIMQVKTEKLRESVSRTLEHSAELSLYKMKYTDVIAIKKQAAYGMVKSYSIIKYSGIIRAGIKNTDDIQFIVSEDRKMLHLIVPCAEILGNDILSQEVFDEKQNIFIPITTQEIFTEIETAKDASEKEIIAGGLLQDTNKRTEEYLSHIMSALGFETVTIEHF